MENKEQQECMERIRERKQELAIKANASNKMAKRLTSKTVILGTIVGSMISGALLGEYEVVAHGAEAMTPLLTATCGTIGGAMAAGIVGVAATAQAKLDQEKLEKVDNQEESLTI